MKLKTELSLKGSLFFVSVFFITACAGNKNQMVSKIFAEPLYELGNVRFIDIDMERLNLEVDLKITNPNYLSVEFQNVNYQLNIDGKQVLTGALPESVMVPAKGEKSLTIPLSVGMDKLANGALNLMMSRKLSYVLNTKLDTSVPILEKTTFQIQRVDQLSF